MTPEEKLLALIQQDKRQAANVTPQEKLLALIEDDKRKGPEPAPLPAKEVTPEKSQPAPVAVTPAVQPVKEPAKEKSAPIEITPPAPGKKPALVVAPVTQPQKRAEEPTPNVPKDGSRKNPEPVTPAPVSAGIVAAQDPKKTEEEPSLDLTAKSRAPEGAGASLPKPIIFPTIRVSGVTITNRVLGVLVVLLIVAVFYSVAGTERSINAEIQKQLKGAGEMSVAQVAVSEEPLPSVEDLVTKVSKRNYFAPVTFEKGSAGVGAPVVVAGALKDLKLVAVSMDAATPSESMGIVKNKADSKTYFVKVGESVGDTGYVLVKVLTDRLVLKQGKQEVELK